jgi:hypothetical protein
VVLCPICVADQDTSVQTEEEAEPTESEKQETLDPDPKPELAKKKPPQVRPWDIGKEGLNEGEMVVYFLVVLLLYLITSYLYGSIYDCVIYSYIHSHVKMHCYDEDPVNNKIHRLWQFLSFVVVFLVTIESTN